MDKIVSAEKAIQISTKLKSQNKTIVLAGGCFDILHVGHITFLNNAKKQGDSLFVLLESDKNIKKIKGDARPINTQTDRANILAHLQMVDYVVMLSDFKKDSDYDNLINSIKPDIIAVTKGDPGRLHKDRQADKVEARVVEVTNQIVNQSTTRLVDVLREV